VREANAMTLATAAADGAPAARTVLLKGYDEAGFVFYTNYESRKGRELAANPRACLLFFWPELERQVRIEGRVEKVTARESDEYFRSRPLPSRIGAWASPQSQVIPSRATLVANAARYGAQFMLRPPRPPHWGGYRLQPDGSVDNSVMVELEAMCSNGTDCVWNDELKATCGQKVSTAHLIISCGGFVSNSSERRWISACSCSDIGRLYPL
jgi:hypothetical protein